MYIVLDKYNQFIAKFPTYNEALAHKFAYGHTEWKIKISTCGSSKLGCVRIY